MVELLQGYLVVVVGMAGAVGAMVCALLFFLTLDIYYGTKRGQIIQLIVLAVLGLACGFLFYAAVVGSFA
jgi:hypothetical protein